jgi:hypothetical protein
LFFRTGHDVLQHASPTQFFYKVFRHSYLKLACKGTAFF